MKEHIDTVCKQVIVANEDIKQKVISSNPYKYIKDRIKIEP